MKDWVFVYGSLVNERTIRTPGESVLVELDGWRREWGHVVEVPAGTVSGLTIRPDSDCCINGKILAVPRRDFAEFDDREIGYRRFRLESDVYAVGAPCGECLSLNNRIHAYRSPEGQGDGAAEPPPILQTYIDCILDGYFRHFGEKGAVDFVHTTDGWERDIWDDRADPVYPRALDLDKDFLDWVDRLVATVRLDGRRKGKSDNVR